MIQSYFLQRRWVFRRKGDPLGFVLVTVAGLVAGAAVTAALAQWLPSAAGTDSVVLAATRAPLARLGGSLVTAMVNYGGYCLWAFRD